MSKEIKIDAQKAADEKPAKQKGFFSRFLKWISTGTEKASRNGGFCNS